MKKQAFCAMPAGRFSAAAFSYHRAANIQKMVAGRLAQWLPECGNPPMILEVGCGTGLLTEQLIRFFPQARIDAVDLAEGMVRQARLRLGKHENVCWRRADIAIYPLCSRKYALVASSSALHWILPVEKTVLRLAASIAPGGSFLLALMLRGTLAELRTARRRVAACKGSFAPLPAHNEICRILKDAGLRLAHTHHEKISATFASAQAFLKALHDQGVTGGLLSHSALPLNRSELKAFLRNYQRCYRNANGVYATYRVGYYLACKESRSAPGSL